MKRGLLIILLSLGLTKLTANEILYLWCGAVTPTSCKVTGVVQTSTHYVRLMVSTSRLFSQPIYSEFRSATRETSNSVSFDIDGLQPNTKYYYTLEIDGEWNKHGEQIGSFTTFDTSGFSYHFTAASCNFFPNNKVYDLMRYENPLFFLMTGDLHYANPSSSKVQVHRDAYENKVLRRRRESEFYKEVPFAYVWDDHDFCGNNNDGTSGCGKAAKQAYMEYIPHYPLAAPDSSNAIYHSFEVGRVRFVISDCRSERIDGDIISETQKNWLKKEFIKGRDKNQLICWVSSVSFSGDENDNWGGYPSTRTEIGNFLRDSNIVNLFIVSGDAHMIAIDNGTHADFSSEKNNPNLYPILQAAALNNLGSEKGGEYSEGGTFPNPLFSSQWSSIDIIDNSGNDIAVVFNCYRWSPFSMKIKLVTSYTFCRTLNQDLESQSRLRERNTMHIHKEPDSPILNLEMGYQGQGNISILDYKGTEVYKEENVTIDNGYRLSKFHPKAKGVHYILVKGDNIYFLNHINL